MPFHLRLTALATLLLNAHCAAGAHHDAFECGDEPQAAGHFDGTPLMDSTQDVPADKEDRLSRHWIVVLDGCEVPEGLLDSNSVCAKPDCSVSGAFGQQC